MAKKLQCLDEGGRAKAIDRYSKIEPKSDHGHSQMHRDVGDKFEAPMPYKAGAVHGKKG